MGSKLLSPPAEMDQRRQYRAFFSDFTSLPPRQTHTYTLADLNADADLSATPIFAPTRRVYVHDVSILPNGSAAGIDDSNTSVWLVTDGTNTMVSKTYNTTNTHPATKVQASLGTVNYNVIEAGGRVELTVTNGTNANTVATLVSVTYSDLESFPTGEFKIIATDDGSATISDGVDGVLVLTPSDTTAGNNDEIYLVTAKETFKHVAYKPMVVEARIQYTEASTSAANVAVGLMDGVAANAIVDDGAGLAASFEGAAIYKVDGGTVWKCVSSKLTTQTVSTSTTTAGGSSDQTLRVEINPLAGSIAEVSFFVDGVQLIDSTTLKPIKHRIDYSSSPTEMAAFIGLKNGTTTAETLNVKSFGGWQLR